MKNPPREPTLIDLIESGEANDGIVQVQVKTWPAFVEYVRLLGINPSFIWRGQRRSDWDLTALLYREQALGGLGVPRDKEGEAMMYRHLEAFKRAARGRRGPNPPPLANENDWWALGQHYGLATPLIDWTGSPFAAAYFAFYESVPKDETPERAIFALDRATVRREWMDRWTEIVLRERAHIQMQRRATDKAALTMSTTFKGPGQIQDELEEEEREARVEEQRRRERHRSENPLMDFVEPLGDENTRLVNQNGMFTRTQDGVDVGAYVKRMFAGRDDTILFKITIPNSERETAMCALNQMNINHATLFPDLYGAGTFCNMRWKIPGYADLYDVPIPPEFVA